MKNELHRATRFLVCMEKYNQLKSLVRSPADHVNRVFSGLHFLFLLQKFHNRFPIDNSPVSC